jgi:2-polyprenyl-3-methyl-5-hydroxy-6-metoxy-1,4-benzoquinol methylase
MSTQDKASEFMQAVRTSLTDNSFVKISLADYKGPEGQLKSVLGRRVIIKNVPKISLTYRYKTRDIVKNESLDDGVEKIATQLAAGFQVATLATAAFDLVFQHNRLKKLKPTSPEIISVDHDHQKKRLIRPVGQNYLQALGIADDKGQVLKAAQDKYKQINKYIEILDSLIKNRPVGSLKKIIDMGSGKGYLTFALADYLQTQKIAANVIGVEIRDDLVKLCNDIAASSKLDHLKFQQGTIADFDATGANVLIALHACDTATDDAIAKGIQAGADVIVVAPCCHKQIRRNMEQGKTPAELDFLLRHGIFMERQAEMVTDGLRALILEYCGYTTKVFEFISDAHTPKNVMIVGVKSVTKSKKEAELLKNINEAQDWLGCGLHYLMKALSL